MVVEKSSKINAYWNSYTLKAITKSYEGGKSNYCQLAFLTCIKTTLRKQHFRYSDKGSLMIV